MRKRITIHLAPSCLLPSLSSHSQQIKHLKLCGSHPLPPVLLPLLLHPEPLPSLDSLSEITTLLPYKAKGLFLVFRFLKLSEAPATAVVFLAPSLDIRDVTLY